jgi:hypothetical protein
MSSLTSVAQTYLYVWGSTQNATYSALNSTTSGYRFITVADPENAEWYLTDNPGKAYAFTVIYSLVTVED